MKIFKVIKPKPIIALLLIVAISVAITFCFMGISKTFATQKLRFDYTIALDAGHGGIDGGSVGINTGIKESDINLIVTKKVKTYLTDFGYNVVLTRENENSLASMTAKNQKVSDMENRIKKIQKNNCDMVVSIHCNYYPSHEVYGAQSFFTSKNDSSVILGNLMQTQLNSLLQPTNVKESHVGDYYLLNELDIPVTIVECGFLSNPEEELLLVENDYQSKLAYAIFCGIVSYYAQSNAIY